MGESSHSHTTEQELGTRAAVSHSACLPNLSVFSSPDSNPPGEHNRQSTQAKAEAAPSEGSKFREVSPISAKTKKKKRGTPGPCSEEPEQPGATLEMESTPDGTSAAKPRAEAEGQAPLTLPGSLIRARFHRLLQAAWQDGLPLPTGRRRGLAQTQPPAYSELVG